MIPADLRSKIVNDPAKPVVAVITSGSLPVPPVLGGGIQTVVYEYALFNKSQNIIIVSALDGGLSAYELDKNGIGHIRIRNKSFDNFELTWNGHFLLRYSRYIHKACEALKKVRPDIIHIHNMPHFIPIVRKALGSSVKIILTNHNTKIGEQNYVLRRLEHIMRDVDAVIYPSRRIAELDLIERFPEYKDKVSVIYNGVDIRYYKKYPAADLERVRQKYKIPARNTLLFVGRLVEEKGAHLLLSALPEILRSVPDTCLVIVGSSFFGKGNVTPYVKRLQELSIPVKDNVIFTGFIDAADLPVLYSASTVFVSPVKWDDPSPKTIYEASACEVPIISAQRGGIPEIVTNGESALLLAGDYLVSTLAGACISLLKDEKARAALTAKAKERVLNRFTCEQISAEWAMAYDKILTPPYVPLPGSGEGLGAG